MAVYMQIQGIDGDVTSKGHQKWIQLDSVEFNVKRTLSQEPGRMVDREGTRPAVSEISVQKTMDKTSPIIFTEACVGKAKGEIKIHLCTTSDSLTPDTSENNSSPHSVFLRGSGGTRKNNDGVSANVLRISGFLRMMSEAVSLFSGSPAFAEDDVVM